jgi:RimJ/RimL family protein N-acetyltransferase
MTTIQTERLTLRRWRAEDLGPMAAINADPEVMRWVGDGSVRDAAQTAAATEAVERGWDERGWGLFAVEVRATGELAGFTGLAVPEFLPEILPAVEIGWRLGRSFWGRGYATEAARAALHFGFAEHALDRVVSVHEIGNTASENVMRKLGMHHDRDTLHPANARPLRVYAIANPEPRP